MSEYVTSRIEAGQYGDVSEYIRDLVRREQERQLAAEDLRRMLDDADASGSSLRSAESIWEDAEARHQSRSA